MNIMSTSNGSSEDPVHKMARLIRARQLRSMERRARVMLMFFQPGEMRWVWKHGIEEAFLEIRCNN